MEIDGFHGPLHKLLELIEEKKMEISRISLAAVTGDFLSYIDKLSRENSGYIPEVIADFITVAAKLILLKSLLLLPSNVFASEDEEEAAELEFRLNLYREFKAAEKNIRALWLKEEIFSRPFLRNVEPGFYFTQKVSQDELLAAVKKAYSDAAPFSATSEKREIKIASLDDKIRSLVEKINRVLKSSFGELTKDAPREELVIVFLALLHLLKDNAVNVRQDEMFSEIIIEKI